jgi:NarL family two-component system response regulator LiaR
MAESIRVMIADDHLMVRSGVAMFLNALPDIELVGQASNGQEAVTMCQSLEPQVVLMDLMMPEMDGVEATRTILQTRPDTRIIALTSFKEDDLIYAAIKAGVVGYLLKDCTVEELAGAIRDARAGKTSISQEMMQAVLRVAETPAAPQIHLSERERSVLQLIASGLSNRQIAGELTLSESTIKFHISNILSKLGVATRAEAVALAMHHKLVD